MNIYVAICIFWLCGIAAVAILEYLSERGF